MGRFSNRTIIPAHGIVPNGNEDRGACFDGNLFIVTTPLWVEGQVTIQGAVGAQGDVTATGVIANSLKFKTSTALTNMWGFVYTADFGAIGIHGSVNSTAVLDVAASGVVAGDFAMANPVGSLDAGLIWGANVQSAANVQLRMAYMGSGEMDPGAVPFKIFVIR